MSDVLKSMRKKFTDGIVQTCEVPKCRIKLMGFPRDKIILDLDKIIKAGLERISGKKCDFIIVNNLERKIFVIPIEFKTNQIEHDKIQEQFEGGINFLKKHVGRQFNCHPVLVSKTLSHNNRRKLKGIKVAVPGKTARIKHVFCGGKLNWTEVIKQLKHNK